MRVLADMVIRKLKAVWGGGGERVSVGVAEGGGGGGSGAVLELRSQRGIRTNLEKCSIRNREELG